MLLELFENFGATNRAVNRHETLQSTQEVEIFRLLSANMQSTSDQALSFLAIGTRYVVTRVLAVRSSGGASVACAGGIYTGAGKTGSAIVGAAQSWLNLSGANKIVVATLAAVASTDALTSQTLYLSLTTGSTAACTADIHVYGIPI